MCDNDNNHSKHVIQQNSDTCVHVTVSDQDTDASRRKFLKTSMTGLAAGAVAGSGLAGNVMAAPPFGRGQGKGPPEEPPGHGRGRGRSHHILLKGGVVLTMDPAIGDFEKADVLIEDSKIVEVRPNIHASAQVVLCPGSRCPWYVCNARFY